MEREPKESVLPIVIAGGAMVVCCLAPVLFVSGASGLTAWLGGIDPLLAVAIAVAMGAEVVLFRRMRKLTSTRLERSLPTTVLKGDQ